MCERYNHLGLTFSQQSEYKESIRKRDDYTCQLCGCTKDQAKQLDIDHIIPWRISRDSSPSNLRVLCHRCNLIDRRNTKANPHRSLDDWYTYLEQELD